MLLRAVPYLCARRYHTFQEGGGRACSEKKNLVPRLVQPEESSPLESRINFVTEEACQSVRKRGGRKGFVKTAQHILRSERSVRRGRNRASLPYPDRRDHESLLRQKKYRVTDIVQVDASLDRTYRKLIHRKKKSSWGKLQPFS